MASQTKRLTRAEAQQATRDRLLEAAREEFLASGFHAASVADISEKAGFSTGAIYSSFGGKDELFIEMLDRELSERAASQRQAMRARSFNGMIRAAARDLHRAGVQDPAMTPLVVEVWIYSKDKPELRKRLRELHERQIGWIARLLEDACERYGMALALPALEVARGGGALSRGIRLERLLDPNGVDEKAFEEMFTAYVNGLATEVDTGSREGE